MCSVTPQWKEQLLELPKLGKNIIAGWRNYPVQKTLQKIADKPGVIPGVISLVCLSAALQLTNQYQILIDGEFLGAVKDKQAVMRYVGEMDALNKESYGVELSLLNDVQVARSYGVPTQDLDDLQIILNDRLNWGTHAAVIKVNGQDVVALKDQATAETVLQQIQQSIDQQLSKQYSSFKQLAVSLAEQVEVVPQAVTVDRLVDPETAKNILLDGKSSQTRYIVSRGDTLSGIAVSRGVSVNTLTTANPGIKPTRLQIGQALNLTVSEPYLHVQETAEVVQEEKIPYTTRYVKDSSMWNWQSTTITPGKDGLKEVTAVVTLVNGEVTDKQVVSTKRLSEPVEAVVKQGTKQAAVQGTGNFIWPTNGKITSGYGWRWGKIHRAVDIGAAQGTPIYAADAGSVVYSGWRTSYGYVIEIDHGNGFHTLYAHCSKLLVSRGQKVTKGQTIAKVGQTGNATGPHVHFEVIKNGTQVNPMNYFK